MRERVLPSFPGVRAGSAQAHVHAAALDGRVRAGEGRTPIRRRRRRRRPPLHDPPQVRGLRRAARCRRRRRRRFLATAAGRRRRHPIRSPTR